ncbi:MAG TPA: SAM-dependent methyltransferase [Nitrospira sp.]|nr:SAM-dependent methyltransferase [Nitrospira sp.]
MRKPSQPKGGRSRPTGTGPAGTGTLFLIGLPIGNRRDTSWRAIETLKRVALVVAESPRAAETFLMAHGIRTTITSYGPYHLRDKVSVLLQRLTKGQDLALVSDSGMPGVCDPGEMLVAAAHRRGIRVAVIPGPSAVTAALACSGWNGNAFVFEGRLPRTRARLLRFLNRFSAQSQTGVFFVEPLKLPVVLEAMVELFPSREVALCVNLTGPEETVVRGRPARLLARAKSLPLDAEVTIVVRGRTRAGKTSSTRKG